jgi:ribosomal protein S18 acetylase RimI-like enzyme
MNVKIRKALIEDFPSVFSLFHQLWPNKELNETDMKTVFDRGITSNTDLYICAEVNGNLIGFCAYAIVNNFWQEGQIAYVYAMIVDEDQRGKGIGSELLKTACDYAKKCGCKKIELDSGFQREKAHKFYTEKMGFEKRAFLFSKDLL